MTRKRKQPQRATDGGPRVALLARLRPERRRAIREGS